jgi:large subunit ribosomal protein L25
VAETELVAEIREATGKGVARKLRSAGQLPAVVYGRGRPSLAVRLDPRALERVLRSSEAGLNTLIDLRVKGHEGGAARVVLVKELQRDPVRGGFLHADLYEVDLTQTVEVAIPIHLIGRPEGVEMGGILDHMLREVEIECLPRAIPQSIDIEVGQLEIGDGIHVRDLALPEGVKLLTDPGLSVAQVVAPAVEEVAVPEAEVVEAEAAPEEAEAPAEGAGKESAGKGGAE